MLKAIVIDDEHNAREKMQLMLEKFCSNDIEVVAIARDANEGLDVIKRFGPDLIFLDIEMPGLTGFDMLRSIPDLNFEIIFTTAHDHYAIKAIKFSALDYLLKPIDIDQLQEAVKKATERRRSRMTIAQYHTLKNNLQVPSHAMEQLAVPAQTGMIFIKVFDIIYCEAESNYTKIYLANTQKIISSRTLKEYEEMLEDSGFVRIHHSFLANKKHIVEYVKADGGQLLMNNGVYLSISRRKKEWVLDKLKKGD